MPPVEDLIGAIRVAGLAQHSDCPVATRSVQGGVCTSVVCPLVPGRAPGRLRCARPCCKSDARPGARWVGSRNPDSSGP